MIKKSSFLLVAIATAALSVLMMSCTSETIGQNELTTPEQERVSNEAGSITIVVVSVSPGEKYGKWPNQNCRDHEKKWCWRWFQADRLVDGSEDNVNLNDYNYVELRDDNMFLTLSEKTISDNLIVKDAFETGLFEIPEDVVVSDEMVVSSLGLKSSFVIEAGAYSAESFNDNNITFKLPYRLVDLDKMVLCHIPEHSEDYSSGRWFFENNDVNDYQISETLVGKIVKAAPDCIVVEYEYDYNIQMANTVYENIVAEGLFTINHEQTISDPDVLKTLGFSASKKIKEGSYKINVLGDKFQVQFDIY